MGILMANYRSEKREEHIILVSHNFERDGSEMWGSFPLVCYRCHSREDQMQVSAHHQVEIGGRATHFKKS